LDAVDTLSTQLDQPVVCANSSPVDTHADERAACTFGPGARAEQTLGLTAASASQLPIRHLIVLMRENRSFDHLLGRLHAPAVEAVPPDFTNVDLVGRAVTPFKPATTCEAVDPDHQWGGMHLGINGGLMNGFVASAGYSTDTDGHFVMGVHDATDLPFYTWLASTFALGSRHFAPLATGTYPNRYFLMFGSNLGFRSTTLATYPPPGTPSIFSELLDAKATWGVYSDGAVLSGSLGWKQGEPGVHSFQAFLDALDQGTLPNVAFVDGIDDVEDDHPPADLQVGERWLSNIYQHAASSPQWSRLAMVWTYDESGAFADHVPPPQGCAPSTTVADQAFVERGPRVPLVIISPWARRGYVSTAVRDHTAITRLIETLFDLPALSRRDANSDAMLDLFDFSCGRDLTAPVAPAPGRGGCVAP
jgi:phospholipase C